MGLVQIRKKQGKKTPKCLISCGKKGDCTRIKKNVKSDTKKEEI